MPYDLRAFNSHVHFDTVAMGSRKRLGVQWWNATGVTKRVNGFDPPVSADGSFKLDSAMAVSWFVSNGEVFPHTEPLIPIVFSPTSVGYHSESFVWLMESGTCEPILVDGWGIGCVEQGALYLDDLFHPLPDRVVDCGVVPVGTVSETPFDVRNDSVTDIPVSAAFDDGSLFSLFSPVTKISARFTLQDGHFMDSRLGEEIVVLFSPQRVGRVFDVLRLTDTSGAPNSFTIAVQGIGIEYGDTGALSAAAAGAANAIDFGNVVVGGSRWFAFYVTNKSDQAVSFDARFVARVGGAAFVVEAPPIRTVPAHDQLGFVLRFTPPGAGDFTASLVIADSVGAHAVARHVVGRGVLG